MPYTLISSVGTGMYKDGYRQTTYTFPDGKTFETRLFLEAILKCKYREIDSVILVGTQTSSWDALVDNSIDNDLWEQVFSATNQGEGIDGANPLIHRLEEYLSNRFANIKFIIKIHTDKVDFDTAESIFKTYNSLVPTIKKENHVLFDITHGFRSMPILLYQALQYSFTQSESLQNVELVYGEYNINTRISIVRTLRD